MGKVAGVITCLILLSVASVGKADPPKCRFSYILSGNPASHEIQAGQSSCIPNSSQFCICSAVAEMSCSQNIERCGFNLGGG